MPNQRESEFRVAKDPKVANESWFKTKWRPAMAWTYMLLIIYDFMLMPFLWPTILFFLKVPFVAWIPLTMQNGGFIHITFGAILGLYTWGRTKEITETGAPDDEDEVPVKPKRKPWVRRPVAEDDDGDPGTDPRPPKDWGGN